MAQQTAVEWLKNRLPSLFEHDHDDFYKRIFEQAKQMEREQHNKTWLTAQEESLHENYFGRSRLFLEYFKETYGNEGV